MPFRGDEIVFRCATVAVGTIITDHPPHRTVRAALPHTAPTLDDWREVLLLAHRSICGTPTSPRCLGLVLGGTMFSLARALFSPVSAEDRSSLFVWFSDPMARSGFSRACASAPWLCAFVDRPRSPLGRGAPEVSRFSCMLFLSVRGFLDYAGPTVRSRLSRNSRVAFPHRERVSVLVLRFSKLNRPAHRYPCLRFKRYLTMSPARLETRMDSLYPYPVGLVHSLSVTASRRQFSSDWQNYEAKVVTFLHGARRGELIKIRAAIHNLAANHGQ